MTAATPIDDAVTVPDVHFPPPTCPACDHDLDVHADGITCPDCRIVWSYDGRHGGLDDEVQRCGYHHRVPDYAAVPGYGVVAIAPHARCYRPTGHHGEHCGYDPTTQHGQDWDHWPNTATHRTTHRKERLR